MLEARPIARKALLAAGVFSGVFWSAMAGTAFMITGGFGFDDAAASRTTPLRAPTYGRENGALTSMQTADNWAGDARRYVDAEALEASPASYAPSGYPEMELDGDTGAPSENVAPPLDEAERAREINLAYEAYEASAYYPDEVAVEGKVKVTFD